MKNNYNITLNQILTDIICTEKSYNQEMNYKQFTIVTYGHYTKTDIEQALIRLMPNIQISKVRSVCILKKQYSKQTAKKGGYYFMLGSNRSHLHGSKKYYINILNPDVLVEYLKLDNKGVTENETIKNN